MSLPTRQQTAVLVRMLSAANWKLIEQMLASAILRERAGSVRPDGYRRNTGYQPGSNGGGVSNPTAAAGAALAEGHVPPDPHRVHTEAAIKDLRACADALARLQTRLTALQRLITADDDQVAPCGPCLAGGVRHPSLHWGTVAGRLAEPAFMCPPVYEFVRRHGRLPSGPECAAHDRTGHWRVVVPSPDHRARR